MAAFAEHPEDEEGFVREASAIIATDAALTEKIVRLINSPFYSLDQPVSSLEDILTTLGPETVQNLVLGVSLFDSIQHLSTAEPRSPISPAMFRRHALGTGVTCRLLARHLDMMHEKVQQLFIAGMLHDVGKLVLANVYPDGYEKAMSECRELGVSLQFAELAHFGCSHTHVGALLARKWQLHSFFENAIQYHHAPANLKRNLMKNLVIIANNISKRAFPDTSGSPVREEMHIDLLRDLGLSPEVIADIETSLERRMGEIPEP